MNNLATFDAHGGFDQPDNIELQGFILPVDPNAPVPRVPRDKLPVAEQGNLAFDIAMKSAGTPAELLIEYNLTEQALVDILQQPSFRDAVRDAQAQLKEHGVGNGFMIRARFATEALMPDIFSIAKSATTDPALRVKIFESMAKYARLDPASTKQKGEAGGGVNVQFLFAAGIKGIDHIMPTVQVIDQ